jgi:serine/threonine protein kinase
MKTYKYGVASFVELGKFKAKKYMYIEEMYWTKEYSTLLYLWKHNHSNIIQYKSGSYINRQHPRFDDDNIECFFELTFPKYQKTLDETSKYDDKGIIQIMIDLLSAIKLCHSLNIWHRDIKQENILIQNGRATLIDFTHALRVRSSTIVLDCNISTYSHRAPEVFKYRRKTVSGYTEKIDVWALGIILFEMVIDDDLYKYLTSSNDENDLDDFFNKNFQKKMMLALKKIYIAKSQILSYSHTYWEWITQMLEYDPNSRISASDMLDTIVQFAIVNDIEFTMPTNREVIRTTHTYSMLDSEQKKLLDDVCQLAHNINQNYCINIKFTGFVSIYKMLVATGTINRENMRQTTLATYMIITNIVYDCIVDVDGAILMLQEASDELYFEKQPLISALIHIMQNNDTDMFLHDTFDF